MDLTVLRMEEEQLQASHFAPPGADQKTGEPQAMPWQ